MSKAASMAKPAPITIPTEPIGSIPKPVDLIERVAKGASDDPNIAPLYEDAIRDIIERFETTGSPASLLGGIGSLAARHGAMSVQSPLTTTTAESHDVPFAVCLALRCRRKLAAVLSVPASGRTLRRLSKEDSYGSHQ